jgi:chromosome partitioning protein
VTVDPRAGPADLASTAFSPPPDPAEGNGLAVPEAVASHAPVDAENREGGSGNRVEPSSPGSGDPPVDLETDLPDSTADTVGVNNPSVVDEVFPIDRESSIDDRALTESVAAAAAKASSEAQGPDEPSRAPAIERVPTKTARVVAVANQKGGVGKSTTAVSLGAALAELGFEVLVVDLDPQGNASTGMGIRHVARDVTTYEVLLAQSPIEQAIVQTPVERLSAVPSTIDLAGAEIELVSQFSRETRLTKALEPVRTDRFDFVILDCPPSLGLLTINALTAADELVVPIQCEYYALEGLGQLLRNVRLIQQNVNPDLRLSGIVMTMFDARTRLSEQVVAEVRRYFGARVFDTVIPRTVRLSEAPGYGQPITLYDPQSKGAETYRALARELAERGPEEDEPVPQVGDLPNVITPAERPPRTTLAGDEGEEAPRKKFRLFRRGGEE